MRYENGVEIRTQGEAPFDVSCLNNASIEVIRYTDWKRQAIPHWIHAIDEFDKHTYINPASIETFYVTDRAVKVYLATLGWLAFQLQTNPTLVNDLLGIPSSEDVSAMPETQPSEQI